MSDQERGKLKSILLIEETKRGKIPLTAYPDADGYSIGVGHWLGKSLSRVTISAQVAQMLFEEDVSDACAEARKIYGAEFFDGLPANQQIALILMAYQMGEGQEDPPSGLRGFRRFNAAVLRKDWLAAEIHGLDSPWAKIQTPDRARRVMALLTQNIYAYDFDKLLPRG